MSHELYKDVWGDSALFAGMLAITGQRTEISYVDYGCVDLNGRIWRNSEARSKGEDYINSSSRDMFMGVLMGASRGVLRDVAEYLRNNKGKLCPTASDNRNKIGWLGWARLGEALKVAGFSLSDRRESMGWNGYLKYQVARHFLGFTTFMEALTVFKGYQINLVYCALLLHAANRKHKFWFKPTLWVLREVRNLDDLVLAYLHGNAAKIKAEVLHMRNRRAKVINNRHGGTFGWPPGQDSYFFLREFPSEVYVRWVEGASLSVDDYVRKMKGWLP